MPDDLTPADVAKLIDTSVSNVRRWTAVHADLLSEGANPAPGLARRYTVKDVEVLRIVDELRAAGYSSEAINVKLAGATIPVVEAEAVDMEGLPEGLGAAQAGQGGALMPPAMVQVISRLLDGSERATAARLDALERSSDQRLAQLERGQRDRVLLFAYGLVAGVVGAVVLFWLAFVLARMAG